MPSEEFKNLNVKFEELRRSYLGFMAMLAEIEIEGETDFQQNFFNLMSFVGEMDFHHHRFREDVMKLVEAFHTNRNPHITEEFWEKQTQETPGN